MDRASPLVASTCAGPSRFRVRVRGQRSWEGSLQRYRTFTAAFNLKDRGLVSPYLGSFVVVRINPLRWIKDEPPPLDEVLKAMRERAARFNVEKIKQQELARSGGAPDGE